MKPKPFSALNHLTLPWAISFSPSEERSTQWCAGLGCFRDRLFFRNLAREASKALAITPRERSRTYVELQLGERYHPRQQPASMSATLRGAGRDRQPRAVLSSSAASSAGLLIIGQCPVSISSYPHPARGPVSSGGASSVQRMNVVGNAAGAPPESGSAYEPRGWPTACRRSQAMSSAPMPWSP